ncbi:outer membrane protein [Tardiphaga sp.]|jgi:outer membrane immunogenic protein|uniref:outer membrane protein n=1 Tax=Tardiphaga sp. TaxID=1926292 RepID=UPI0037D9A4EA
MKKFLLGTAALLAMGASASAADLAARPYTKAPAYVAAPIYNWTGFYIGGHVGGAFNGNSGFAGTSDNSDGRFLGGVQAGADYQFAPNWVIGVEGQYSWVGNNNTNIAFVGPGVPAGTGYNLNQKGLASVTGRLGYTWGPALLYVKGGWAYQDATETLFTPVAVPFATTTKDNGYTVGAGLEYLFTQNWSGKIEYQYYDFGNTTITAPAYLTQFGSSKNDQHVVKAGLNYRFNWGGPVVAKY